MKKIIITGLSIAAIAVLTGCGGGGGSSNSNSGSSNTGTGSYQDSAVNGVSYKCGSKTGVTDTNGKFTFEKGQNCEFTLAGAKLRDVNKDDLKDGGVVLEDNTTVQALLQTLDVDGNASNGIQITPEEVKAIKSILKGKVPDSDTELTEIHSELQQTCKGKYKGHVVDKTKAEEHFHQTAQKVITNLLKGKTFYMVDYDDDNGERNLVKVTINSNVTSASFEVIEGPNKGKKETSTLKVMGDKLITTDNDYSDSFKVKEKANYIQLKEVGDDDKAVKLYSSETDAKAEYQKYLAANIKKLMAGKTLYTYDYDGTITTAVVNSDATTIKIGPKGTAESIKIENGVIIGADGTKNIIDEITDKYIKGHSEINKDDHFVFFFNKADAQAHLREKGHGSVNNGHDNDDQDDD